MPAKYSIGKPDIDRQIESLAKEFSHPGDTEYVRQILTTAIKLYFDGTNEADLRLINISLKEMRHAFRIFAPYRDTRKVVLWGSARARVRSPEYRMALEFSRKMAERGFMVITGGGGGVMEAGNRGAGRKSFGINIQLPMEQEPNPYLSGKKKMNFHYFFTRKLIFVKESDATVLFPGGYGTNDEAFEILTLAQTGKSAPRPIILAEPKGSTYWSGWLKFLKCEMVKTGFISKDDLGLFSVACSADAAIEQVMNFYRTYHSIRYVGPLTIMRLNRPISDSQIAKLNKEFSEILVKGDIKASPPRPEEVEDRDCLELPRLSMQFDKHNFGKLHRMIARINGF